MVALAFCNSRAKVFVWFALVNWLLAAGHEYASGKALNEPTLSFTNFCFCFAWSCSRRLSSAS